jgi:tetratricopeptide (TPR) repeat protein
MKRFFAVFFAVVVSLIAADEIVAQNTRVDNLLDDAREQVNNLAYEEAIKNYKKALKIEPENVVGQFEMAMAYYRLEKYSEAIKFADALKVAGKADVDCYRLLGNAYDLHGSYDKGIIVLKEGVEAFPEAGELYLDLGIIEMIRKEPEAATLHWEAGIEADPSYPDNYYWAAKMYANSNEKVWALLYGEVFMNMERGTERFDDMSNTLYDLYLGLMGDPTNIADGDFKFDRGETANGFEGANVRLFDVLHKNNLMSFERGNTIEGTQNKLLALSHARKSFLEMWLQGFTLAYPNLLYKYHRTMNDLGFFEAYNFWLFSKASPEEFLYWVQRNGTTYEAFIDWFLEKPLKVDVEDYFVRSQFVKEKKKSTTDKSPIEE